MNNPLFTSTMVLPGLDVATLDAGGAATTGPRMSHDWRKWVAENLLLGLPAETLVDTMVRGGIERDTAISEIATAQAHPYFRAAAGVRGAGSIPDTRLAKRDWVLEIYRRSARLDPATAAIPIVHRPTRERFLHEFYAVNRPCIIEGAMDNWPATTAWTMENLKRRFGRKLVEIQAGRSSDPNYELNSLQHKREMLFGDYADLIASAGRTNDFYMTANNSGKNREALAEAWNDIVPFPEYLKDDPGNSGFFWFGPAGIITPVHHDLTNNFMAQVVGRKAIKLIAPYELPYLYNHRHCFSQVDMNQIDYDRFPMFREVRVIELILNPGQLLFLPVGWWHHVTGLDISITMTFTNFVFDNDFYSFYKSLGDI
jgi:hypothetical protein